MATPGGRVKRSEAIGPLVLAIDIGSTASRGDVYDAAGRPVQGRRQKVAIGLDPPAPGLWESPAERQARDLQCRRLGSDNAWIAF
jgi:gluconokinase